MRFNGLPPRAAKQRVWTTVFLLAVFFSTTLGCGASPDAASLDSDSEGSADSSPSTAASLLNLPNQDLERFDERWHTRVQELEAEIEKAMADQPMDPNRVGNAFGALGQHYMAHHLVDMATVCFDYAQSIDPEEVRWPYLNGFLHQIQSQFEEAAEDYGTVLSLDSANLEARLRLATVAMEMGEIDQAESHLDAVIAERPDHAMARYELGRLRLQQSRLDEAVSLLSSVTKDQPSAGVAQYALAQAYRRAGDTERARKALELANEQPVVFPDPLLGELGELGITSEFYRMRAERAVAEGRLADAVNHYGKAVELGDNDYQTRMMYAFVLHQSGDRTAAISRLQEIFSATDLANEQKAEAGHRLGLLYGESGEAARAIQLQLEALELDPSHVGAQLSLADASARTGKLDDAVERYSSILKAEPDHLQSLIKRGTALLNLERTEEGLSDLRRAVALGPENLDLRLRWVEALEHVDRADEAEKAAEELSKWLLAESPDPSRERSVIFTKIGHKLRRYGHLEAAEKCYRNALQPVPETVDLRMNLADILVIRGSFDEAQDLYSAVQDVDPENGEARLGSIRCQISTGQWAAARSELEAGLRVTQSGRLLHLLGRVLAVAPPPSGDPKRALEIADEVFNARRTPDHAATLAMALAADGQFEQAARFQEQLIADTSELGDDWIRWLSLQLEAYRTQKPWRPDDGRLVYAPVRF